MNSIGRQLQCKLIHQCAPTYAYQRKCLLFPKQVTVEDLMSRLEPGHVVCQFCSEPVDPRLLGLRL